MIEPLQHSIVAGSYVSFVINYGVTIHAYCALHPLCPHTIPVLVGFTKVVNAEDLHHFGRSSNNYLTRQDITEILFKAV